MQGEIMRSIRFIFAFMLLGVLFVSGIASAADYNSRFVRNYPPGYNGMWYYAERFFDKPDKSRTEEYRWDKFTARINNIQYPFLPHPYAWNYGDHRSFNLPDYNSNDW
jgi:hypothetical protein